MTSHQIFLANLYLLVSTINFDDLSKVTLDKQHVVVDRIEALEYYLKNAF
ncbi:hypothetical protein MGA5115_01353 [Marinomonas gallaica]|uniref:Uncharacterized protein n=1 Tax=Marinomonas gallaica TaxID=1806667 RepID=A0A1C3JPX9_9GAMM|nr:hypothetical protein [Marinomonas gallaica]SBT17244.1 hypothetical protein MGA5115_01353 [Marinomonas gallaica]SBT22422.1 hypothetical protein MGA5116_03042 [Marinomonas gallaica]